jgi:hypothetical protein
VATGKAVLALLLLCVFTVGCAQTRTMRLEATPPDLFDPCNPVEINSSHAVVDRHGYVVAGAGEGAATGFAQGALGAIGGGASTGDPYGLLLGVLLAPVFAVGGGVYGAAAASPSDEVEASIAAIQAVYDDNALLGQIPERLAEDFKSQGFQIAGQESSVAGAGEGGSEDAQLSSRQPCSVASGTNRLDLTIRYAFRTKGTYTPDLIYGIEVEATAAGPAREKGGHDYRWVYLSPEINFLEVTKNGASVLRASIENTERQFARAIANDLFLAPRQVTVRGVYAVSGQGRRFAPKLVSPGKIHRFPTNSQLAGIKESQLTPADGAQEDPSTLDSNVHHIEIARQPDATAAPEENLGTGREAARDERLAFSLQTSYSHIYCPFAVEYEPFSFPADGEEIIVRKRRATEVYDFPDYRVSARHDGAGMVLLLRPIGKSLSADVIPIRPTSLEKGATTTERTRARYTGSNPEQGRYCKDLVVRLEVLSG